MYAEVNQLFGDIVKVTPSSKVVGDMTLFLMAKEMQPSDILALDENTMSPSLIPSSNCFPASSAFLPADGQRSCRKLSYAAMLLFVAAQAQTWNQ